MRFVLNGVTRELDAATVVARLREVAPEAVQNHGVRVGGVVYPVKQAFERATGLPRPDYTSHTALRQLRSLGFEVVSQRSASMARTAGSVRTGTSEVTAGSRDWPWEGAVQSVFAAVLVRHGWSITAVADTATKARGVDVLAEKGPRRLGAEVKGWPSVGYADPRRAAEVKRTQPSTQAGHWFSQALLKAMELLDSHPERESLMVLPDFPRYRDLTGRTRTGRQAAGIHVVLLGQDGALTSQWWSP
jgi:hypothetical protein